MKKIAMSILLCVLMIRLDAQMNGRDFQNLVQGAIKALPSAATGFAVVEVKNYKPIESVKESPLGTWRIVVTNWGPSKYSGEVNIFKSEVLIKNEGNSYSFISASQVVDPVIIDEVMEQKYVVLARKYMTKKINKAEVDLVVKDNRHYIMATGSLSDNPRVIMEDMTILLDKAKGFLHSLAWETANVEKKRKEDFEKDKITMMPKGSLPFYLDAKWLGDFEQENMKFPNGYYTFINKKLNLNFYMYNKEDQLTYYIQRVIDEDLAKNKKQVLIDRLEEYLKKNSVKAASSTEAVVIGKLYGIKIVYNYDGSIKGKDMIKSFDDTQSGYREKLSKELIEILADI